MVPLPKRLGPGGARNEAVRLSRGVYLTTLDSDDCLADAGKISREMSLLLAERGRVIAFSDVEMISPAGVRERLSQTQGIVEGGILETVLTRAAMIPRDFTLSRRAYEDAGDTTRRSPPTRTGISRSAWRPDTASGTPGRRAWSTGGARAASRASRSRSGSET